MDKGGNHMKNSIKQLLRTPIKAILFLSLMLAGTILFVFSTVMLVSSLERINAAKAQFTTIGTVAQKPSSTRYDRVEWSEYGRSYAQQVDEYSTVITPEQLLFEGADYVIPPKSRPYYQALLPEYSTARDSINTENSTYILEFTLDGEYKPLGPFNIKVEKIIMNKETAYDNSFASSTGFKTKLTEGDVITLFDFSTDTPTPLVKDKRYICNVGWSMRYQVLPSPYSTQYGIPDGEYISPAPMRDGLESTDIAWSYVNDRISNPKTPFIEEVTYDFYQKGGRGEDWLAWADMHRVYNNWFYVYPTDNLQLLPAFHDRQLYMTQGRTISEDEFLSGANVCIVPSDFASRNRLEIGDKITLPLSFSLYGYLPDRRHSPAQIALNLVTYCTGYSPLNADLKPYEPFYTNEYEVVGFYAPISPGSLMCGSTEIATDMFVIPSNSVKESDENNIASYGAMNGLTTTFQIPNGTVQAFDTKLRSAVPEVDMLTITYNDNGYSDVVGTLENARLTAILLFFIGLFTIIAIVILLLFIFIVKQKKRTAIERSLGMSKRQCRNSLISGILVLTIVATIVGSGCGALVYSKFDNQSTIEQSTEFDTSYSMWATNRTEKVEIDKADNLLLIMVYLAVPIFLILLVFLSATVLVNQILKIEPLLLLGKTT